MPEHLYGCQYNPWVGPLATDIPSVGSTMASGPLPDGRIWLLSNSLINVVRDPLYISSSVTGWDFNNMTALTSCTLPAYTSTDQPYGCIPRFNILHKEGGCQMPQGMAINKPGYTGFWAAYAVNQEDIWVLRAPFAAIP
jgi:hypothetical protein